MLAIEIFRSKFYRDGILNHELLKNMIKYILNNCILVYIKTGNFSSAYRLFSILNDRGVPLENSNLLKSINLGAICEEKRKHYQNIWEQIEENLGREELEKLLGFIRTILKKRETKKSNDRGIQRKEIGTCSLQLNKNSSDSHSKYRHS